MARVLETIITRPNKLKSILIAIHDCCLSEIIFHASLILKLSFVAHEVLWTHILQSSSKGKTLHLATFYPLQPDMNHRVKFLGIRCRVIKRRGGKRRVTGTVLPHFTRPRNTRSPQLRSFSATYRSSQNYFYIREKHQFLYLRSIFLNFNRYPVT